MAAACSLGAQAVVTVHALLAVGLVVFLPAVWLAASRRHPLAGWAPGRVGHLLIMVMVVTEDLLRVPCPLTALERAFTRCAGGAGYSGDFLAHAAHQLLYFHAPAWVFSALHAGFFTLVVVTWWRVPVTQWTWRLHAGRAR